MLGQPLRPADLEVLARIKDGITVVGAINTSILPAAQIAEAI